MPQDEGSVETPTQLCAQLGGFLLSQLTADGFLGAGYCDSHREFYTRASPGVSASADRLTSSPRSAHPVP